MLEVLSMMKDHILNEYFESLSDINKMQLELRACFKNLYEDYYLCYLQDMMMNRKYDDEYKSLILNFFQVLLRYFN